MGQEPQMVFGSFRFDPANEQLWRGEQEIALRPKPLAVLHYLVEHPRRLVTKEELIKSVWAGPAPSVCPACPLDPGPNPPRLV